jgi:hypothetical protein
MNTPNSPRLEPYSDQSDRSDRSESTASRQHPKAFLLLSAFLLLPILAFPAATTYTPAEVGQPIVIFDRTRLVENGPGTADDQVIGGNGFRILPITPQQTAALLDLPFHHRDPFDRLMIAQAMTEEMGLISCDSAIDAYPVNLI